MKFPKIKRRDRYPYYVFAFLGMICVLNLNAVANKYFGFERFFSPFILLLSVIGCLLAGKHPVQNLGKYGIWFVGGYFTYLGVGCLSAYVEKNTDEVNYELLLCGASIAVASATIMLARRLINNGHGDRMLSFMYWLSLASAATVFLSYLFPQLNAAISVSDRVGRMSGFFGNPNELATQTLIATAFGFCMASKTLNLKYLVYTFIVCIPAVLASHSRSAIVGMVVMVGFLAFQVFPPKYVIRTAASLMVVGIVSFLGFHYLQQMASGGNQVLETRTEELFEFFQGDIRGATTGGRFDLASEAINLWLQRPIIGHGLGDLNHMPIAGLGPHNMFLKMLGETGIIGISVMGTFWLAFALNAWTCKIRWLKVGLLGMFLAITFSLVSSHNAITRRFMVFELAFMIVLMEPAVQKIIAQGNSARKRYIFFQPPMTQQQPWHGHSDSLSGPHQTNPDFKQSASRGR